MIDIRLKIRHLLPQQCALCAGKAGDQWLCPGCEADLPWHAAAVCPRCALPTAGGEICGRCLQHPPAFDATHALLAYRFPVDALLQRYKYAGLLAVAEWMGAMLARKQQTAARPDAIVPMPLHASRLKERGFNQATEIARVVSRQLGIPLALQACVRTRPTQPQAGLSIKERRRNIRGVFVCKQSFAGKHVVLLDDIMTTGASLDALALALKHAGAARVECWVAARTLKD